MSKLKKGIAIVAAVFTLGTTVCFPAYAATATPTTEKDLIKEQRFTTTDTNFQYDFEETIEDNGKKYNLKSVNYEVESSKPLTREESVVHKVDYKNRYGKDVHPEKSLEIIKYNKTLTVNFKDLTYTPTTITNRTETVSAYTDFSYKTVKPTPDETKTITFHDNISNKDIKATLQLKELQVKDSWAWRDDVTIPITFSIYDAEYYALGDKLIPYDNEKPAIAGFEKDILNELNLDTEKYRITDIRWDGEPYTVGEVRYRKAVAAGERYAANYVAVYESSVRLPDVSGYDAVATYTNTVDIENGEREYTVKATAVYERDYTLIYTVAGVAGGLIFLALLVVLILYIISRKKENDNTQSLLSNAP